MRYYRPESHVNTLDGGEEDPALTLENEGDVPAFAPDIHPELLANHQGASFIGPNGPRHNSAAYIAEYERLEALCAEVQLSANADMVEFESRLEDLRRDRDKYEALAQTQLRYKSLYNAQCVISEGHRRIIHELTEKI